MKKVVREVSSYIENEAKEYTFYTIVNRALPSLIDGLKPSQRFVLYSAIQNAGNVFKKNEYLCGVISEYGYNHGASSAFGAAALLANDWNNNYPILEGEGNFGSRAIRDAAEPRYIHSRLNKNFDIIFKDTDIVLPHEITSYTIPKFYYPIIPFVLINGIVGIATAYACNIPPHDIFSVIDECISYVKTGDCKNPKIKFPSFIGNVNTPDDGQWTIEGLYELQGKTKLLIKEIPLSFDRIKYVSVLNKLIESEQVVSFDEVDGDGCFTFRVTLKRDFDTSHENIMDKFCLRENLNMDLTTIGPNSDMVKKEMDLRIYDTTSELIKDFVDYRVTVIDRRIENMIDKLSKQIPELKAKSLFITNARNGKYDFTQNKKGLINQVEQSFDVELKPFSDKVVGMPIFNMTSDEITKLENELSKTIKELEYWKTTNSKKEYIKDLTVLKDTLKKDKA
ncbi:topoisomerase II medium subunit [Aeromonas phage ZPAH1]|nr:topoisomerase II medium subunit [Aeromonas phage Aswh_1]QQG34109.1 topoisomerase II medium subunit [Aeromonas phage ZPAH1]